MSGTICKSLVHKFGCNKLCTIHAMLNIATNHASGEEVVGAVFEEAKTKGKEKRERAKMNAPSPSMVRRRRNGTGTASNKKRLQRCINKRRRKPDYFKQLLEKSCTNHGYLVKHKLKDCKLMKQKMEPPCLTRRVRPTRR